MMDSSDITMQPCTTVHCVSEHRVLHMSGTPNFQLVGRLQLFEFAYTLFLLVDGLSLYFVLSAAVFTVRESIDKLYLLLLIFRYV